MTSEYFLDENIFNTDAKTSLTEFNIPGNEELDKMFKRIWYDENKVHFITVTVMEYKDRNFGSENNIQTKSGSVYNISENTTRTYLNSFTFQDELISEYKIETKQEQGIKTTFSLNWFENRFSFSVKTISSEYQDDMKEIARNIIKRYPK